MTESHFALASSDSSLEWLQPESVDISTSASVLKSIPTAKNSSASDCPECLSGTTSPLTFHQAILSQTELLSGQGFPVSPFLKPGSNGEMRINGISGLTSCASFARLDPSSGWVKTSQGCEQLTLDGCFEEFSKTFPVAGIVSNGVAYQLPRWMQCISENESGSSLTDQRSLLPTPKASDANMAGTTVAPLPGQTLHLSAAVRNLPTPQARDIKGVSGKGYQERGGNHNLPTELEIGTKMLNPPFVSAMMGLPPLWADTSCDTATLMSGSSQPQSPPSLGSLVQKLEGFRQKIAKNTSDSSQSTITPSGSTNTGSKPSEMPSVPSKLPLSGEESGKSSDCEVVIAGVDESKRGSYFGPLVAVAYVIDEKDRPYLQAALAPKGTLRDSKQLSKAQRKALLKEISRCGTWRLGYAKSSEIDKLGIDPANFLAFRRAIAKLPVPPTRVLVDGNKRIPGLEIEQEAIPQGDTKELAIAAASILCKEFSDDLVERLGAKLPHSFAKHHGYSCDADLRLYGAEHRQFRRRFNSVKRVLEEKNTMVASVAVPQKEGFQNTTTPFLKWAGGKTWAIPLLQELYASHRDRRYCDLTLGSGAIPLALQPDRAYLCDKNPFLIRLWEWVQADGRLTIDLRTDKDYYLECRDRFNNYTNPEQQAQLFYYLNHTCWRGLYRSSKEKFFNVPWGDYKKFHGQTDLSHYKQVIGHWEFAVESWKESLQHIQSDDFVVFDPPYHSADGEGFTQYFGSFTEADQIAAAEALSNLDVPVVAFNAATDFILDLYRGLGFTVRIEKAPRMISSSGDRTPALEMVATKNTEKKPIYIYQSQPTQTNFTPVGVKSFYSNRDCVFDFEILEVHPDLIDIDLDTQCRSKESHERIDEYVALMNAGEWDVNCEQPFHEFPELVAGEEGQYYPLSHHRSKAAKIAQFSLKYKVWKPVGGNLPVARFLAAASNPSKELPWTTADHRKRVHSVLDGWEQISDAIKDQAIEALNGVIEGQQLTRLRNSRELSDYVIANILGIPSRTVTNHRKVWENQRRVKKSGIKIGDRICVVEPLKSFAVGESGVVADIDSKKAEVWVSWDGQPGQAPFPIPLAYVAVSDKPRDAVLHFNALLDLLNFADGGEWNKDKLVAQQQSGIEFEGYHARYSSLNTGYWFVTPNDERLEGLLKSAKEARQQFQAVQSQATPNSVLPEVETEEGGVTVSEFEEQAGTTPEQYAQAATVVPPLKPLPYAVGEVVMAKFDKTFGAISGLECLGEVRKVEQLRCIVYFGLYQVEHPISAAYLKKVTDSQRDEVVKMYARIDALCRHTLDPVDKAVLEQLSRMTKYSDRAYRLLDNLEREYEGTAIRQAIEEFRT